MLAVAVAARYPHSAPLVVRCDHGVHAVGLAHAAIVLDRLARPIYLVLWHLESIISRGPPGLRIAWGLWIDIGPECAAAQRRQHSSGAVVTRCWQHVTTDRGVISRAARSTGDTRTD